MKTILEEKALPDYSVSEDNKHQNPELQQEDWTLIIKPQSSLFDLQLAEVWRYRDLMLLFVRRDFVTFYKQTILGPLWFFLQPILTTVIFTFVFGRVANLSTDGIPHVVFYLSGIVLWNYFAECVNKTSGTFTQNANLFGKVYFPRIVLPLSIVVSNLLRLGVQLLLFVGVWVYFFAKGAQITINAYALLFPVLILIMAALGLGLGMIISSLTTKYRDLTFLITFGVQLAMYASPVIYPISSLDGDIRMLILANPMSAIIETFRYGFLGEGTFSWALLGYSAGFSLVALYLGTLIFNKVQRSFMDTV
ncbi:ABC transporter permease [Cesiribacter sp. SM1]|uniref:ABC transporter permease n=1 Tax=Cesiribacter sp. SM1 TaxID=2861196 RepID=UPI001CD60B2E|nr:ABC transporter permease [Cesiribacter sp. SM1]